MQVLEASLAGSEVSLEAGGAGDAAVGLAQEFEARLAECSTLAFRVALGVLRNAADAEEVAQEAFIRAYRCFYRLRDRERFRGWLARIAWRLALDRWRSASRRERREQIAAEPAPVQNAEELAASWEFQGRLQQAVDELPPKLRQVLILAAVEGYNIREVAGLLGLPDGTVKSRLHLARKAMIERLKWIAGDSPKS
jgi:RNA polymerase sigma-70 factor (ECF subfamily)